MIVERSDRHSHTVRHTKADGTNLSDDEGLDPNSGLGPLAHIHIGQPQSLQQMSGRIEHPDNGTEGLDPNVPDSGINFTEEDRERFGFFAPTVEVLDPNSGLDPLTQFNFDPSQMHGGSGDNEELDPNTGRTPGG
jgi:hypothetical protein